MIRPYITRFLLAAAGERPDQAVELVRFDRGVTNYDRRTWLGGIDPAWQVIEEHTRPIPEHRVCGGQAR